MIKCARRLARLGAGMIGFSATLALSISTDAASAPFSPRKNLESESIHRTSSMNKSEAGRKKPPKKPFHATGEQHVTIKFKRKIRSGGGGMFASSSAPHSSQAVTKQYIGMRSPTSTPLDLVQMLPSMNVSTPDPTGMQGGALSVRGLTGDDMALLLNGTTSTPLAYFNEVSDPENLKSVTITPGSSSIDLPASSAAAGVMEVTQSDPTNARTGMMDFTYGSNDLSREFIRLDTGKIANTGVSSFFSFSHENSHSWMGVGRNDRKHIDFGLKKEWGNGSNWNIHTSFNDEDFTVDNYPTTSQFKDYKHTGNGWGHSSKYTGLGKDNGAGDNYYKANINQYKQLFVSAPLHLFLTNRLSLDIKPYLSYGTGWVGAGTGACVYDPSSNSNCGGGVLQNASGNNLAPGTAINDVWNNSSARTAGVISKFNLKWDRHNETTIGYWYENYANEYSTNTNIISANGAINGPNSNPTYLNGHRNETAYDAGYALNSWFIQNRSHYFNDKLVIMAGFKYVMSSFWNKTHGPTQSTKQTFHPTAPLPQLSIGYKINDHHQFYLNAQGDFRQPDPGSLVQMTTIPKTQYSIKEELGYRYNNRYFMVDLSFFNYNITDRLNTNCLNSACTLRSTYNSGSQTSRGFDALIAGHPWHHISPYASIEYLHATIDSDTKNPLSTGPRYLHTKGLQAPLAPHVLANFGLTYSTKSFFGNFGMHYAGPQSTTLTGTERIPGYITDNISLGYHFHSLPFAHSPTLKLNFQNLTGAIVRTSANGVALGGPGQQAYYLTVPRFFMSGTISTSF